MTNVVLLGGTMPAINSDDDIIEDKQVQVGLNDVILKGPAMPAYCVVCNKAYAHQPDCPLKAK
jgi:hypothetical protein